MLVKHEANRSSGGHIAEIEIGAFISLGNGPEQQGLLRLIATGKIYKDAERGAGAVKPKKDVVVRIIRKCGILTGPGRDVSQLSDDQLRDLVAELERRFRDEALTSAPQAATIILDVKADRWRILVGADAHKIDEMVRQSPERAYDVGFFDEFARAAGWTERASLENPELRQPS